MFPYTWTCCMSMCAVQYFKISQSCSSAIWTQSRAFHALKGYHISQPVSSKGTVALVFSLPEGIKSSLEVPLILRWAVRFSTRISILITPLVFIDRRLAVVRLAIYLESLHPIYFNKTCKYSVWQKPKPFIKSTELSNANKVCRYTGTWTITNFCNASCGPSYSRTEQVENF